jgi:Zn-dependent protease with chaperone function
MNSETFDALVQDLEQYSKRNPQMYQLRVGLLALLGYAYLFLVVSGLIAAVVFLIWLTLSSHHFNAMVLKAVILLLIPICIVVRSLWVRWKPPQGIPLTPQTVPKLFALINDLAKNLKTTSVDYVLLTDEFNAGVMQVPRLGLLGWHANYLVIGLPLMQALSPKQFRAVLAHELGHLSGNHNRFRSWIYRVRQTWGQILERLQTGRHSETGFIFSAFFNWYAPFFSAYSFVLARANEYEADRCAAEMAGQQNAADALVNLEVRGAYLSDTFWPQIRRQADLQPGPPTQPYHDLAQALTQEINLETAQKRLATALEEKTNTADTHPCLRDRLRSLGLEPTTVKPTAKFHRTAAEYFLDTALDDYTEQLNQEWQTAVTFQWKERHTYVSQIQASLSELEQKFRSSTLSIEDAWKRAQWTLELKNNETALPLIKAVLEESPTHAEANYVLGRILAEQSNPEAISYLETAMQQDQNKILSGCQIIGYLLTQQGRESEIEAYRQRAQSHYQVIALAEQERFYISEKDNFFPHGLSKLEAEELCRQLRQYPYIQSVYLVQKKVQYFPENPLYVMFVIQKVPFWKVEPSEWKFENLNRDEKLINRLMKELKFPNRLLITAPKENGGWVYSKLRKIEKTPFYRRRSPH